MRRNRRYNQINGMRNGKSVYLIGSGTSLKGFDFSKLNDKFTIAVNHTIEHYPEADCLIFGDKIFLHKTTFDLESYKGLIFCSERCKGSKPIQNMLHKDNLFIFEDRRDEPILNAKMGLFHPTSSGILALSLALQMRAKKIYLLGYDYYYSNNQVHFYKDYEHHKRVVEDKMKIKMKKFKYFKDHAQKIINLNPDSKIEEFKKMRFEDIE